MRAHQLFAGRAGASNTVAVEIRTTGDYLAIEATGWPVSDAHEGEIWAAITLTREQAQILVDQLQQSLEQPADVATIEREVA